MFTGAVTLKWQDITATLEEKKIKIFFKCLLYYTLIFIRVYIFKNKVLNYELLGNSGSW